MVLDAGQTTPHPQESLSKPFTMMTSPSEATEAAPPELPAVLIPLFKGVVYRDEDPGRWGALLQLQGRVRGHVAVLGLALSLDDAEGYAFLRSALSSDLCGRLPKNSRPRPCRVN